MGSPTAWRWYHPGEGPNYILCYKAGVGGGEGWGVVGMPREGAPEKADFPLRIGRKKEGTDKRQYPFKKFTTER